MKRCLGALTAVLLAAASVAQEVKIDAQAEVAAALFAASATQAALAKSLDAKLKGQQEHIAQLAAEIRSGDNRHRAEIVAAQQSFIAELAAKDREYAAQIEVFRGTVTDIAATPGGVQALERFNAGDEVGALTILDQIRAGNEKMRAEKLRLEDAADARRIARLALEARNRGKITIDKAIARFEEVVKLDPGVAADWQELERMYLETGKLTEARKAVDSMAAAARNDFEHVGALRERADVLVHQGDLSGARSAAEEALKLSRRLLAADPADRDMQLQFAAVLQQFGEVARRQGDLASAENAYNEEVAYMRRRATGPNASDVDRHALASDLLHLADTLIQRGEMHKARDAIEENLSLLRAFQANAPDNIKYAREISVSLMWLSDVLDSLGQFTEAHRAGDEIIATSTRLSEAEPNNATVRADLGLGHLKKAVVTGIEGKLEESAANYERARSIFHDLASAPGASVDSRMNEGAGLMGLSDAHLRLDDAAASRRYSEEAAALYRKLAAAEPTDAVSREDLAEALYYVAAAATASKDFAAARHAVDEGLAIDQALLKGGFNSSDVQFDISTAQLTLGDLLHAQGRSREALVPLRKCLETRRRLEAAQPGVSSLSHGVAEAMHSLVVTPGSALSWDEFARYLESMQTQGTFWPIDRGWLDEAHQHAGVP
jgi:tetratricopeptide (TPR) repeat protein